MTTEEKLEHFKETAMRVAREESDKIIQEYSQNLDQIFEEHKESQKQKAEMEINHERERIQRDGNAQLAREQMHIKRRLSRKQSELKDKLFDEVSVLLKEYKQSEAYTELLISQIKSASEFAKGELLIVYIDPEDKNKLSHLQEVTGTMLTVSSFSFGGGTRAVIPKKNILIDNSFDTKYEEAKGNFNLNGGIPDGK